MCSAFYCLFVPSFVSILHSNLFSPQTNRWRAAICKTEQGGEELERRLHEEREAREGRGRKREKEEWREAGTRGRDETERERLSGEKKKGNKMKW